MTHPQASNRRVANANDIPLFTLAQGPIAPIFPAIPANGQITFASLNGQDGGVHIRPIKQVLPTLDAWNLTVQRQVTNTISAEVAYVGNKGSHGFSGDGPNYDVNPLSMFLYGTDVESRICAGHSVTPSSRLRLELPELHRWVLAPA